MKINKKILEINKIYKINENILEINKMYSS